MKDFRRYDINNPKFIRKIEDKWSLNWIEYILQWNANEEKYERCAKIRDFVNSFKEISVDDKKNVKNVNVEII
jgi:protein-arginine kinase activator protein McsA